MRTIGLLAINLALALGLTLATPYFATAANLRVLVDNMALEAMALAALALLLIGGLFDLSVDGTVALSGVVAGKVMMAGASPVLAILAALMIGLGMGLLNGWVVSHWRINPLMATMATWWIAVGITLGITKAMSPYGFPAWFQAIGQTRVFGVRAYVVIAILSVLCYEYALLKTAVGNRIMGIGGSRAAAFLCGVNVDRISIGLYIQAGIMAAVIGLIMAARLNSGTVNATDGMTLRVIAAAIIGGCSLSGGKGSILAGLLGLMLIAMLANATILLNISPYWQKGLIGGVLLTAIATERIRGPSLVGGMT